MMVTSGETVTVEMASHHACDDYDKMVLGDSGMESVFEWSSSKKGEAPRRDGRRRWRARDDGPDLRGAPCGRHPRRRDRRPDAAAEQGRQDVRLERGSVVGVPGALGPGRRHPLRRGRLHGHAGEQRRGDHDLRDHRGGRRGTPSSRTSSAGRRSPTPRARRATTTPTRARACRTTTWASPRRRRRWGGRRRRRSRTR